MKPILHTWCPRAHLPIANCAVLVLSRQSTQFVRTTPVCKHPHSVLWPWKPLYLQIKAVIFFHFFYSNLPKRQIQIHKPLKKRLDYLQDIFLTMNLLTRDSLLTQVHPRILCWYALACGHRSLSVWHTS